MTKKKRTLVQERSKALFASIHTAQIAAAINTLAEPWTIAELKDALKRSDLPRVPDSCVAKEVSILETHGLVEQGNRDIAQNYQYTRRRWPAFWMVLAAFAEEQLPEGSINELSHRPSDEAALAEVNIADETG